MKLPGFLNKPRWQAKDAAERRTGVAGDDDAELIANLPRIAREDADAGVRIAAARRLADPALAQRLAHDDADAAVRGDARKLWLDLIAGTHAQSPSATDCLRLLGAQDDAALIEHVARTAKDTELRAAALARVTRTPLLAERATADPAPALRLAALERIEDEVLLERLAERTRKTDKQISRRARERADALRIARGDSGAAIARARLLCERLEQMVRVPQPAAVAEAIETQWAPLEAQIDESLKARYRAARALLAAARETRAPAPTSLAPEPVAADIPPAADSPIEPVAAPPAEPTEPEPAPIVEPLLAQVRFEASVSAAQASKQLDHAQRQAKMQRIEAAVLAFENAVEEGSASRAHLAHAELAALRKETRESLPRALMHRLAEAERRYAELSRWQHWSDNQRRRQLCESIEALAGRGLHPDAVATRVREAQGEWSRLDAAEGHGADHAAHGWARRFHSACRHALEPAKSYFKKRQELRKTHAAAANAALEEVAAIPADSADFPRIATARNAIVANLRALDLVDPHDRKTLARNLKSALVALDERLARHHADVESTKAALIAEAQALASEARRGVPAAARALQQRWREAGNGRRGRDQAQWKVFRAALDVAFGKLDEERAERTARDSASRTEAQSLCAELEGLAHGDAAPSRAAVSRIENAWDALNVREDALTRRFRAAQAQLREAAARRDRVARRAPYDAWLARYKLCRATERSPESAEALRAQWDLAPTCDIAASALAARFESAATAIAADDDALREVLIRIEILAGTESPREDHERRRALQVERLSARMRGATASTPQNELTALLTEWSELGPAASPELDVRLERDLIAAVETLP